MVNQRHFDCPSVVRTLGLPRDFQIMKWVANVVVDNHFNPPVVRRRGGQLQPVRKVRADERFVVVNRVTGWQVRVHSVKHTLRAFVKWLLWRFRKDNDALVLDRVTRFDPSLPISPPLFAPPTTQVLVFRMFLFGIWRVLCLICWELWEVAWVVYDLE
jgi:hypothetical protein